MLTEQPDRPPADAVFADCIRAIAERQDRAAFGRLFEHFAPRLKSYFIRAGIPSAQAEDLAQDAMLAVWRRASQFDSRRAGAATWLFAIARNLRIDLYRRHRSEQAAAAGDQLETTETDITAGDILDAAEREARIRSALTMLSSEQQSVIRLSFFSDTPHREIASQLGIPLGTVKSRIRLAFARLREILGEM